MSTTEKVLIFLAYLISGLILYSRTYGLKDSIRHFLTLIPIIGIIYFLNAGLKFMTDKLVFGLLTLPIIVGIQFMISDLISIKICDRPFLLHAMGSRDLNGLGLRKYNRHFKLIDKLLSIAIILMWIGWPIIYILITGVLER